MSTRVTTAAGATTMLSCLKVKSRAHVEELATWRTLEAVAGMQACASDAGLVREAS